VALYRCPACGFLTGIAKDSTPIETRYASYHSGTAAPEPAYRYEEWLERAEASVGRGRLLEVGAGRGGFVRTALRRGWLADATELSRAGLESLRGTGANVFEGDVAEARYADARFDLIVSLEVLEHLPEPATHLRELWRITRPGGLLLLTTPNFGGLSRRWLGMRWRVVAAEHLGYFTPRTLGRALRSAGYGRIQVRSRSLDISSWRNAGPGSPPPFDPNAAAKLRDTVEARPLLRVLKDAVNGALGLSGLGDSLLAWAWR
jgi:SAM-dependent methyltransferase